MLLVLFCDAACVYSVLQLQDNAVIISNLLKSEKLIKCLTFFAKFLLKQVCININNFNYINIVKIRIPALSPTRRH